MLVYRVSVQIASPELAEKWVSWLKNGHMQAVLDSGAKAAELICFDGEHGHYEVCYHFADREAFTEYEREHAPALRAEGVKLFPVERGFVYSRTVGEVLS